MLKDIHARHVRQRCDGLGTRCGAAAAQGGSALRFELEARATRGAARSGLKGALQQRLRELIIADALSEREAEMELGGGLSDASA